MDRRPTLTIESEPPPDWVAQIKVVGVGGGGGNVINTLAVSSMKAVEFIACHTKLQALDHSLAGVKVQLGPEVTRGFGCGGDPDRGREAAQQSMDSIRPVLAGADMVFIAAGMGGGTGTGGAPLIASAARELGALTVGVVTTPFPFEGRRKMEQAHKGIALLKEAVDALLVVSNEKLISVVGQTARLLDAFRHSDEVLCSAISGITEIILSHGVVNADFADMKTVIRQSGRALMGTGHAAGERRAIWAAQQAVSCPLLEDISIEGATGLVINVTSGPDLTLSEMNDAVGFIQQSVHEEATIIYGHVVDQDMVDQVRITVIATGIPEHGQ